MQSLIWDTWYTVQQKQLATSCHHIDCQTWSETFPHFGLQGQICHSFRQACKISVMAGNLSNDKCLPSTLRKKGFSRVPLFCCSSTVPHKWQLKCLHDAWILSDTHEKGQVGDLAMPPTPECVRQFKRQQLSCNISNRSEAKTLDQTDFELGNTHDKEIGISHPICLGFHHQTQVKCLSPYAPKAQGRLAAGKSQRPFKITAFKSDTVLPEQKTTTQGMLTV